ncbi:MAG: hypothetical protein M4579_002378 [Chaenotheca gracillima]|nr:MAG: hypothetical protein M4579_002378 [Chaenotheca gracillima]
MASAPSRVVTVPRSDGEKGSFVLLQIQQQGEDPLGLRLTATAGSAAFTTHIEREKLPKYRAKNYRGSDEEWSSLISRTFGVTARETRRDEVALRGLETVASVAKEQEITLTIRRKVEGITQRLGSINLGYDAEQEISLYEWAAKAARAAAVNNDEVASLQGRFQEQEESIKQLNHQLEGLIKAKKEHEDALFEKFRELLNTKKLKIRDQQRLLNGVDVGSAAASAAKGKRTIGAAKPSKTSPSAKGKRKAVEQDVSVREARTDSDSDDEFEKMDVDRDTEDKADEQSEQGKETPDRSDDETTEGEDGLETSPAPPARRLDKPSTPRTDRQEVKAPPPRRELPFTAGRSKSKEASEGLRRTNQGSMDVNTGEDTEGETDDDEL